MVKRPVPYAQSGAGLAPGLGNGRLELVGLPYANMRTMPTSQTRSMLRLAPPWAEGSAPATGLLPRVLAYGRRLVVAFADSGFADPLALSEPVPPPPDRRTHGDEEQC
jgi:hypothetical protein